MLCHRKNYSNSKGGRVQAGGLVGQNESWNGDPRFRSSLVNSFWDRETTGQGSSRGSPNSAGLSTAALQILTATGTATNEDDRWSANNWDFGPTCQYPTLRSYKTNDATPPVQIQGDLLAGQPAPKLQTVCPPSMGLTPDANTFINDNNSYGAGNVVVGESGLLTYTITAASLTEDVTLALGGEGAAAFAITGPTNTTLSPTDGALSQVVTITFSPAAEERYVATITHAGGGLTNSLVLTIAGRGTVTGEAVPALSLPTELSFGDLSTNATPATQEYTITGVNLTDDVILALTGDDAFTITNPTNTTLTPEADGTLSQAVTITCEPTAEQAYTATITDAGGGCNKDNGVLTSHKYRNSSSAYFEPKPYRLLAYWKPNRPTGDLLDKNTASQE